MERNESKFNKQRYRLKPNGLSQNGYGDNDDNDDNDDNEIFVAAYAFKGS